MQPIYEQITDQIKAMIIDGTLKEEEMLPSVRTLAKELKISALTVKKAYDFLEEEGFVVTVHGKGSFIAKNNQMCIRDSLVPVHWFWQLSHKCYPTILLFQQRW